MANGLLFHNSKPAAARRAGYEAVRPRGRELRTLDLAGVPAQVLDLRLVVVVEDGHLLVHDLVVRRADQFHGHHVEARLNRLGRNGDGKLPHATLDSLEHVGRDLGPLHGLVAAHADELAVRGDEGLEGILFGHRRSGGQMLAGDLPPVDVDDGPSVVVHRDRQAFHLRRVGDGELAAEAEPLEVRAADRAHGGAAEPVAVVEVSVLPVGRGGSRLGGDDLAVWLADAVRPVELAAVIVVGDRPEVPVGLHQRPPQDVVHPPGARRVQDDRAARRSAGRFGARRGTPRRLKHDNQSDYSETIPTAHSVLLNATPHLVSLPESMERSNHGTLIDHLRTFSPGLRSASGPATGLARCFPKMSVSTRMGRPRQSSMVCPTVGKHSDQRAIDPWSLHAEWGLIDAEHDGNAQGTIFPTECGHARDRRCCAHRRRNSSWPLRGRRCNPTRSPRPS